MATIEVALMEVDDNADATEKAVERARFILNALFAAYGNPELKPGAHTIRSDEVEQALTMALAMVHASETSIRTPKDFRDAADTVGKNLRKFSQFWRENLSPEERAAMGMQPSTPLN
jgi:hypothetical protein